MKTTKFIIATLLGFLLLSSIQACTDHFDELNTSPTLVGVDVVDPAMLFSRSVKYGVYAIPSYSGFIKHLIAHDISPAAGNIFLQSEYGSPWNMYTDQIISISEMIRLTDNDPWHANNNAMGRIWRVWLFQQITDHYGDIPYFEAARAQTEAVTHPTYDTQRDIYVDMMEQLKQAAADLQDTPERGSLGSNDLIYGGNVEMWRRFANSLRLRYALRVRFADEQLAVQHISEVINAPLIADNSQNAQVMTLPDGTVHNENRHPVFNQNINPLNPIACTHTIVYNMREVTSPDLDMDDPRLPIWCQPSSLDGEFRGRLINASSDYRWFHTNQNVSRLGERMVRAEQPIKILTYAEVELNKAEIFMAGLASGNAQAAFQAGLRAELEFYEVEEAEISAFLASSAGTLSGSSEDMLRQIASQKYLSLFQQTAEAYSEWRRTGYPAHYLYSVSPGHTNGQIPRRQTYLTSEYDRNRDKLQEAIDRLGGSDGLLNKVWWDARPGLPIQHPDHGIFPPPPDQHFTPENFQPD